MPPANSEKPLRLAIVQPVLAPYARPVFEHLAAIPDIDLKVFVLRESLHYRPGWAVAENEAFAVEVVGARIQNVVRSAPGNRQIKGLRLISIGLAWKVAAWRPDVVLCTDPTAFLTLLPLKVLHPCPIGILVEETELTASRYPRWLQKARAFMYRRASFWLPYGETKIRYLKSIGAAEARIFPGMWSVDNAHYERPAGRAGRPAGEPRRWMTVGQLVPRKGFSELIDAWAAQGAAFLQKNTLWIVGEGPSQPDLERQVQARGLAESVTLLGHKTPAELADLYRQCDAFVFPTLMDHWGLVVNEAMAAGLPILCSQYAGCHLDLIHPENGVLFDPLDAPAFARAIGDFWQGRDRWVAMGTASRRIVSAYTPEASARAFAHAARAVVRRAVAA